MIIVEGPILPFYKVHSYKFIHFYRVHSVIYKLLVKSDIRSFKLGCP